MLTKCAKQDFSQLTLRELKKSTNKNDSIIYVLQEYRNDEAKNNNDLNDI